MTDIDAQVAAFARDIRGLAIVEPEQIWNDTLALTDAMLTAPDHESAATALRTFLDDRADVEEYAKAVAIAALGRLANTVMLSSPASELAGDDGLIRRLLRLSWAARGAGLGEMARLAGVV